ncbi:hypothetical protein FA13DRAFT_1740702 [Coprinellus micaceus]|uniref:Protein ROT1 n=1 Tax=Coprinellus micaceus TaxID=71717 RepID=A0A4Y7SLM1_COPMI|nr:hypothetical protein FA13DRAFT_1744552 [Coprinellus micaceus]TEB22787.1 hypothetical protein FA13DRAFT_1740702 [Coprinellus micaceus]
MWTGSDPTCITGVIGWVHGKYTLNANGSIWMRPFGDGIDNFGDGFQQVQDPCAAVSNFIESYNETEYYKGWRIFNDPSAGPKLHLFQFDGSPSYVFVSRRGLEGEEVEDLERRESGADAVRGPRVIAVLGAAGLVVLTAASMMI